MKNRREIIRYGALTGAALILPGGCAITEPSQSPPSPAAGLRSRFDGDLVYPSDRGYDSARALYWRNPTMDHQPAVIAHCANNEDVARCIQYSQQHTLPLAIRSGGHSFAGWGSCENGIVVDTSLMQSIEIDEAGAVATVGAGVTTEQLASAAAGKGLAAASGQCPDVGVCGLTLGGGLGWLAGRYGAACDSLLAAELVTAEGKLVIANEAENPDLLWALKGGGGNFGVVTSLTLQLYRVASVTCGRLDYRINDAAAVLRGFSETMASAPDELQASLVVGREKQAYISILLCWSGDTASGHAIVSQFQSIAPVISNTVKRRPFTDSFDFYQSATNRFSAIKGCYLQTLSEDSIDTLLTAFERSPASGISIGLDHYMHGAVCRVPPAAAAFECRTPGSVHSWIAAQWDDPAHSAALLRWIDESREQFESHSGGRAYVNFPARAQGGEVKAAYPGNYQKLMSLKAAYDPGNLFRNNYNIPPAVESGTVPS